MLPPQMPNFIRYDAPIGRRQDGFKVNTGFPIEELDRKEALEYGELMKQAFIKHWEKQSKQNYF